MLRAASAALVAVLMLPVLPGWSGAQSIIPKVSMTIEPDLKEVDASAGAADAVYNCSIYVEGLPLVRYRVNLTADCEGWEAVCVPNVFQVTGSGNNTFTTTVKVPSGAPGGDTKQLTVNGTVLTSGLPLATCTIFAILTTKQSYGLKLSSEVSALTVKAGMTVTWPFAVKNTGNGRDSFSVSVVNLQSYTSAGWTSSGLKFNRSILSIDAGDAAYAQINITPPNNSKDQTITFQISAYSRGAHYNNMTVENQLDLALTVESVPGGGGGGKTTPTPKPTPGPGPVALAAAAVLAAILGLQRRK